MAEELTVITTSMKLTAWTLQKLEKLPRSHRYGLGLRIETKFYELVDCLIEAKYSRQKTESLRQAALRVEQIRFLLRTCFDIHVLAAHSHHYAIQQLDEIGRAVGAWRKHAESRV